MLCLFHCRPTPLTLPSPSHGPCSCRSRLSTSRFWCRTTSSSSTLWPIVLLSFGGRRKGCVTHLPRASMRESPYDLLGVSPSATPQQIKKAYRKLALKYHPDVNKEANAQEKFMRIKHAYNTLINPKGKSDYYSTKTERSKSWNAKEEEEFYGLDDFFRDLQEEFQNWEANPSSQEKPKSLWEELADIGEEFVEFLEKELNIPDTNSGNEDTTSQNKTYYEENATKAGKNMKNETEKSTMEDNIDEIEDALARLKKELGL